MDFVTTAANFAIVAHAGMKYGEHTYFDGHLSPVAFQAGLIAQGLGWSRRDVAIVEAVAYLHDVVEDTNTDVEDIRRIAGMPHEVATLVHALTKNSCVPYSAYISTIPKAGPLAVVVKIADSLVNYKMCLASGEMERAKKYVNNLQLLTYALERINDERNKNRY